LDGFFVHDKNSFLEIFYLKYREFGIGRIRRESLGVLGGKAAQNAQNPSYPELTLKYIHRILDAAVGVLVPEGVSGKQ